MRKILLFIASCMITRFGFSQPLNFKDSSKAQSAINYKAPENTELPTQPGLTIYPNPARNKITIQVINFNPGMASVKVLDIKGKLLREDNRLLTTGTEDIIMFLMLKAGIYFILVIEPGKAARKKLVVF